MLTYNIFSSSLGRRCGESVRLCLALSKNCCKHSEGCSELSTIVCAMTPTNHIQKKLNQRLKIARCYVGIVVKPTWWNPWKYFLPLVISWVLNFRVCLRSRPSLYTASLRNHCFQLFLGFTTIGKQIQAIHCPSPELLLNHTVSVED